MIRLSLIGSEIKYVHTYFLELQFEKSSLFVGETEGSGSWKFRFEWCQNQMEFFPKSNFKIHVEHPTIDRYNLLY